MPCCQVRTGILFLGFFLGFIEVTIWVLFYTFRFEFRYAVGYSTYFEEDLIALSILVSIDVIVNILLISGGNKDYSGRQKDLNRWGLMIPWLIVYGINILALFAGSIIMLYALKGSLKALGLIPMFIGCILFIGHFAVLYFLLEQRSEVVLSRSSSVTAATIS